MNRSLRTMPMNRMMVRKKSRTRSEIMASVKSRDTAPEKAVRSIVHRLGYRFRLRNAKLPGSPDLAFPSRDRLIFVHGCFWHGHDCVRGARIPVTNQTYWISKIQRNRVRDRAVQGKLKRLGWKVAIIWECELKNVDLLERRIRRFFKDKTLV